MTNFDVAVKKGKKKDESIFYRATAWGKAGETIAAYTSKGKRIYLAGEPDVSAYIGRDGVAKAKLELTVTDFEFLSDRNDTAVSAPAPSASFVPDYDAPAENAYTNVTDEADDVFPF